MRQVVWSTTALICLVAIFGSGECRTIVKRGVKLFQPMDHHQLKELTDHSIYRDKRKVEVVTGVKNAVLGFVFNKINSFIDQKTHWVDQLDKTNVAKNKAHHIYPPEDPIHSLSSVISGAIGEKLQAAAPFVQLVTNKLTGASGASSSHGHGFNFGSLITKGFGGSSGASGGGGEVSHSTGSGGYGHALGAAI